MIDKLCRDANLFVDTSGVQYFDLLVETIKAARSSRLIFGSDGPFVHPGVELEKVKLLGLDKQGFDSVAGNHIARLVTR